MDLHAPAPPSSASSDDGMYDLAEPVPSPAPVDPGPAPAAPSGPSPNGENAAGPSVEKAPAKAATAPVAVKKKKKRRRSRRFDLPSWAVSFVVHAVILMGLAAFTFSTEEGRKLIAPLSTALVTAPEKGAASEELTPIYADPTNNQRSDQAVGNENADKAGGGGGTGGVGTGPPSTSAAVAGVGGTVGEKTSLPGVQIAMNVPGISLTPAAPGLDLGGSGMIAGDVTYEATDVGASLDQIAREILRHLTQHKLTVVWLFDESSSMKDDQQAIKPEVRPDRQASSRPTPDADQRGRRRPPSPSPTPIVGFGEDIHYVLEKPTGDIERIGRAIDKLRVDDSGVENTLHAVNEVIGHYGGLVKKDHRLLIVLVTDESGDDGGYIEEAHQAVVEKQGAGLRDRSPVPVRGRPKAHLEYRDPITKDLYWPWIQAAAPRRPTSSSCSGTGCTTAGTSSPRGSPPTSSPGSPRTPGGSSSSCRARRTCGSASARRRTGSPTSRSTSPSTKSRNAAYAAERNKSDLPADDRRPGHPGDPLGQRPRRPAGFYRRHFPIFPEPELLPAANQAGQSWPPSG